jgi:predicted neuraminidase
MNIVPLAQGEMAAFYRHRFAENVLRSTSHDGGFNWSAPRATPLPNNNSSIQAVRLRTGEIAIAYNHSNAASSSDRRASLYDEIEPTARDGGEAQAIERPAIWGVPRAPLSLAFSSDGGVSFGPRTDLETGSGYCLTNNSKDGLNREFSYPSIVEAPNGDLDIAFTYFRRAIKHIRLKRPVH